MKWSDLRTITVESQTERVEERSESCPLCDFVAPSERILVRHMAVEHPERESLGEDPGMVPDESTLPWSGEMAEAIRPSHVRAEVQGREATDGDQINAVANLVEAGIDEYLHSPRTTQYVQVWHASGHVHVKMALLWEPLRGPDGADWASARIGLDEGLVRFPRELIRPVQALLVQRYERAGWSIRMNDKQSYFTHPE